MKKIFLLSFLLFLFSLPLSSLSINDFNFYLEPQLGTTFGKIGEYLHTGTSDTSRIISYLEWEEKPLVVLNLKGGAEFNNIDLSGFVSYALPFQCGQMTDSDWYVQNIKNKYGVFENKVCGNIDTGITVTYYRTLPQNFTIKPIAGLEYKYLSFMGTKGRGWYSNNQNASWETVQTPVNLSGIDYYQHSCMIYAGAGIQYDYKNFSFNFNLLFCPFNMIYYIDYHEDYNNLGRDYSTISLEYGWFNLFKWEFYCEYKMNPKASITFNVSSKIMPEIKGETANCYGNYHTGENTDDIVMSLPQATGTSISEMNISFGYKYTF